MKKEALQNIIDILETSLIDIRKGRPMNRQASEGNIQYNQTHPLTSNVFQFIN